MNMRESLEARSELKKAIRFFFENLGYLEVDTPIAVVMPGTEVYLDYFETSWHDYKRNKHGLFLRSSPEIHMKQLLANDCDRIFQMARCFRNTGELSPWHHPEFDMLEWYQKSVSYENFMDLTTSLLRTTLDWMKKRYPDKVKLNLPENLEKISVYEAFHRFAGLELRDMDMSLAPKAIEKGVISVNRTDDFETTFFKVLLEKVEPAIEKMGAVILYDYPPSQAALAKIEKGSAKRFEYYINGIELCNAFQEELDAETNHKRIIETSNKRRILSRKVPPVDNEFILSLNYKSSMTCGNALGFDRWFSLIFGHKNLDSSIPFRKMKPYERD